MEPMSDDLARLDQQLSEPSGLPRLDLGPAAVAVAVGVLALLMAYVLPWSGPTNGWSVLSGHGSLGKLPQLFTITSLLFGVLGSAAALMTRRWPIAWACALGGGFSVVNGVWAVWSRQTVPGGSAGPGAGMLIAVLAMVFLTIMWVRLAWSRPGGRANG
jgi:hypothetical protein